MKEPFTKLLTNADSGNDKNNESQGWCNSTQEMDQTRKATRKEVQTLSYPFNALMQGSAGILGSSKEIGYQGILSDSSKNNLVDSQNKTNYLCLAGGYFPWNQSYDPKHQSTLVSRGYKGKKIADICVSEDNNKMEDIVADSLLDMCLSNRTIQKEVQEKRKIQWHVLFAYLSDILVCIALCVYGE
ncbi:hypothetical protein V6N11_053525 [Hibiscus sabdariffa]|uniref:Uncharacterized protein n=1 Tax=Hibiscus sabdariffa TaxID=183260 RepID=A0ABR2UDH8_9ROSI